MTIAEANNRSNHESTLIPLNAIIAVMLALMLFGAMAEGGTRKVPSQFPTIQIAVNAAAPGDTIEVDEGVYVERVVIQKSGITLCGDDAVIDAGYAGTCVEVLGDEVRIEGLALVNGLVGIKVVGRHAAVINNELRSLSEGGIDVRGDDAKIIGNELCGVFGDAIYYSSLTSQSSTKIEDNEIDRVNGGIMFAEGGKLVVRDNRGSISGYGIQVNPSHVSKASIIRDNQVTLVQSNGIDVECIGAGVIVRRNEIRHCGDTGISVEGFGATVEDNKVRAVEDRGIRVNGDVARIADNELKDIGGVGIRYIAPSQGQAVIEGNEVEYAAFDAITVTGSFNEIVDNEVEKNWGDGIDIRSGNSNRIVDNRCERNAHEGIDNSGTNTILEDNDCEKNGDKQGPDIAGRGVSGVGSVAVFKGNKFKTGGKNTAQRLDNDGF